MVIKFDQAWMLAAVLLWVRLGVLVFLSPFVSAAKVPVVVLVLFTGALAGVLAMALGLRATQALDNPLSLTLAVGSEVVLGALLGLAVQCAFAAFSMAGQMLDLQMGFGIGSVFDPVTRSNAPVLGTVLALFSVAYFFAADGHLAFMRGIAYSMTAVPPGTASFHTPLADLLRPVAAMFSTAIAAIAPVLFLLLLVEAVLMMLSRVLPQMNIFFVAVSAKILIGFVTLAFAAAFIGPVMSKAYAGIFRFWDGALR